MKCSQYNVKVFEIEVEDSRTFLQFLDANRVLLRHHLLSIRGEVDEVILAYLDEHELHYVLNMKLPAAKRGVQKFKLLVSEEEVPLPAELEGIRTWINDRRRKEGVGEAESTVSVETTPSEHSPETERRCDTETEEAIPPLKIVKRPLRSGQTIEYDGSLLMTERINSGAKVAALGSIIALGTVEGNISSFGECVIVPPLKRGTLFFHGRKIENDELIHPLNKISLVDEHIVIQPINKKEFH